MVVSNPNYSTAGVDFHIFQFDNGDPESNDGTTRVPAPGANFRQAFVVIRDGWTAADLAFQFKLKNDDVWRDLRDATGDRVRLDDVLADEIIVCPDAVGVLLRSHLVAEIRLASIATSSPWAGVNQGDARTVYMYYL